MAGCGKSTLLKTITLAAQYGELDASVTPDEIEQTTRDVLRIEEGSLYPALRRLEELGVDRVVAFVGVPAADQIRRLAGGLS